MASAQGGELLLDRPAADHLILATTLRTWGVMNRSQSEAELLLEFDRQPAVAYIETDRFCDGCGYNLRTQPVRREPRTDLLVSRCPECGRFQPARDGTTAGRVWLRRLGTLLLLVWIMTVLGTGFGLAAAQVGLTLVPLEELTVYRRVTIPAPNSPTSAPGVAPVSPSGSPGVVIQSGTIVIQPGNVTATTTTTYRREVRDRVPYYAEFVTLLRGLSFALGFVLAMLAAVVLYHWRRWCYVVPVVVVSVGAAVLVWYIWRVDQPRLLGWATPHIIAQAAAHFAGGLAGILLGRPLARLIATIVLPPRVRQVLAFLWLADGKQPPTVATASSPG